MLQRYKKYVSICEICGKKGKATKKSSKEKICVICEICVTKNNQHKKIISVRKRKIRVRKQKSLRNLSKSEALIKEGGYLLSRIALQYHRRK